MDKDVFRELLCTVRATLIPIAMKALFALSMLAAATQTCAQSTCALNLWAQPNGNGYVRQQHCDTVTVDLLTADLQDGVRSLQVADGFTVLFYQAENLFGPHILAVTGPRRIDDLATMPMLSLNRNWDNAIASFSITRTDVPDPQPVVPPMVAGLAR